MSNGISKLIKNLDSAYSNWGIRIIFIPKIVKFKVRFLIIKSDERILTIKENYDPDFGTFGIGKIRLHMSSRRTRNSSYATPCQFDSIKCQKIFHLQDFFFSQKKCLCFCFYLDIMF